MSADDEIKQPKPEEQTGNPDETGNIDTKEDKPEVITGGNKSIYQNALPNQVSVAKNHPLQYYTDRSRRILRKDDKLIVKGRGATISMACTLVEVLKRQKIAQIEKVNTGMDIQSYFVRNETRWTSPQPIIKFELTRGEFATCVSDYHQRKVIEIFEKNENTKETGLLSIDELNKLNLSDAFKANDEQKEDARQFLDNLPSNPKELDLPNFIKYASILIHPLLKDSVFKEILDKEFGIVDDTKKNDDNNDEKDNDDMEVID